MVLGLSSDWLGNRQVVLLEIFELFVVESAHVLGSEDTFLENISFHGRDNGLYSTKKEEDHFITTHPSYTV